MGEEELANTIGVEALLSIEQARPQSNTKPRTMLANQTWRWAPRTLRFTYKANRASECPVCTTHPLTPMCAMQTMSCQGTPGLPSSDHPEVTARTRHANLLVAGRARQSTNHTNGPTTPMHMHKSHLHASIIMTTLFPGAHKASTSCGQPRYPRGRGRPRRIANSAWAATAAPSW